MMAEWCVGVIVGTHVFFLDARWGLVNSKYGLSFFSLRCLTRCLHVENYEPFYVLLKTDLESGKRNAVKEET